VTSSVAVFEAAILVKSMYDKILMRKGEKGGNMKLKKFIHNLDLKEYFGMEYRPTAC